MSRFGVGETLAGRPAYMQIPPDGMGWTWIWETPKGNRPSFRVSKNDEIGFGNWAKSSWLAQRSGNRFYNLPTWNALKARDFDMAGIYYDFGTGKDHNKKRYIGFADIAFAISVDLIEVLLGYTQGTNETYHRIKFRLYELLAVMAGDAARPGTWPNAKQWKFQNLNYVGPNNNQVDSGDEEGGEFRTSYGERGTILGLEHYRRNHKNYDARWDILAMLAPVLCVCVASIVATVEKEETIRQRRCAFAMKLNEYLPGELTLENGLVMRGQGGLSTLDLMNWSTAPVPIRTATGWFVGMEKFINDCMVIEGYVPPVDRNANLTSYDAPPESKMRDFDARVMFQQQTARRATNVLFGNAVEFKAKKEAEAQAVVEQAAAEEAAVAEQAAVEQKKSSARKKSSLVLLAAAGVGAYLMTRG